ncbi:MAG: sensor domain-containing phosphodiesterase [Gammaproteobacteria bacterium SHHR-1]|uniref:sensor domain-containing protein n=1 Tax=Magnetovirga frankeli TaxID=947516 RepID=UPI001AF78C66|nr:sensor domain-containing phosphodiesterase [gamma proteobacterium SS-5]
MDSTDKLYELVLSSSLDMILSSSRDPLALCDEQLCFRQINLPFTQLTRHLPDALRGKPFLQLTPDGAVGCVEMEQAAQQGRDWQGVMQLRRGDGRLLSARVELKRIAPNLSHSALWLLWLLPPETEQNPTGNIQHDSLTGLPNRALFLDRVDQALIAAARVKKSVALLLIGVDRFVLINDGLGREVGDLVLKEIGQRLSATIRRSDTLARLDGDMFGAVMQIASTGDSVLVAEKILHALGRPIRVDKRDVTISVSIGISIFPEDGGECQRLLSHAESAMRHQKKQGGNHYQFFAAEMNQAAKTRIEMERGIRQALISGEFVVYYQPKVSLGDNAVVGAEALVRWQRPGMGLIPPGDFIPVAEEAGLVGGIGDFVLRRSCQQAAEWLGKGYRPLRISVNVTASQFRDPQLLHKVEQALADSGLPPQYLELEITESMLVGNVEEVIRKLTTFRDMGIHISIDDFGTGYSSLSYLSRFPITTLKIDRAFIQDMVGNPKMAEITNAIIGLSRGLGLEVVAEGAESLEHIDILRGQSCDLVQGFFYSRPLPPDEFERILSRGFLYDNGT